MKSLSAVLHGIDDIRIEDREVTALRDDGDRVAIEPGFGCRQCNYCKSGDYNLCADMRFAATPPVHGTLTQYYVHPADFCFKLPDHVSFEEGAMLEPLSVAVHSLNRAQLITGESVLITGAGAIGLVTLLTARAMGADMDENRLTVARRLGADATVLVERGMSVGETSALITTAMNGEAPRRIVECSGAESSLQCAINVAAQAATIVLVGRGAQIQNLPIASAVIKELDIRGLFRYVNCYPLALSLIASGRVDVKPLITHRFTLQQTVDAFTMAKTAADNAIKVVINVESSN